MKSKLPLLAVTLCLLGGGCLEPQDGCLDERALNFDISADRNCCCNYPRLMLKIDHQWDTLTFVPGNQFLYNADTLVFEEFLFFLSDFTLGTSAGLSYRVEEQLVIDSPAIDRIDDVLLVQPPAADLIAGTFVYPGIQFDRLSFELGLPEELRTVPAASFPEKHPVRESVPKLLDSVSIEFVDVFFKVSGESVAGQSRSLLLKFPENVFLQNSVSIMSPVGFDTEIKLSVDYRKWIEGVNFLEDTNGEIMQKMLDNAALAILIEE